MFSAAIIELKELLELERRIASFDATLAADRSIVPAQSAWEGRRQWEDRAISLKQKYELL